MRLEVLNSSWCLLYVDGGPEDLSARQAFTICRAVADKWSATFGNIHYWLVVAWGITPGSVAFESLGPAYAAAGGGLVVGTSPFLSLRAYIHVCSLVGVAGMGVPATLQVPPYNGAAVPPA